MAFDEIIIAAAARHNIVLAARPSPLEDQDAYLLIVDRETDRRKIKMLLSDLRDRQIRVHLSFASVRDNPFEVAIRESVASRFGEAIYDISISTSPSGSAVSITHYESDRVSSEDIRNHVREMAALFGIDSIRLSISERALKPSVTEFLQLARVSAPATCEGLQDLIQQRGYPRPDLEWINHQFDLYRKKGFLVRRDDRSYVLTLAGLLALGSGKGRYSPDVRRVLDLARAGK